MSLFTIHSDEEIAHLPIEQGAVAFHTGLHELLFCDKGQWQGVTEEQRELSGVAEIRNDQTERARRQVNT